MSRTKPEFVPEPRGWSSYQVACRLGHGEAWFREHRPLLEAEGFPRFDELIAGWDSAAIERWLDQRSGLLAPHQGDDQWMEALR